MEQLPFLTDLTILLIVGIVCTVLAKKLQISNVLLLILAGIGLTQIPYPERTLFQFPPAFLTIIATITLVIVLFDSSARFKWKIVDQVTGKALKLATVFLIVNAFLLSIAVSYIFEIKNLTEKIYRIEQKANDEFEETSKLSYDVAGNDLTHKK